MSTPIDEKRQATYLIEKIEMRLNEHLKWARNNRRMALAVRIVSGFCGAAVVVLLGWKVVSSADGAQSGVLIWPQNAALVSGAMATAISVFDTFYHPYQNWVMHNVTATNLALLKVKLELHTLASVPPTQKDMDVYAKEYANIVESGVQNWRLTIEKPANGPRAQAAGETNNTAT